MSLADVGFLDILALLGAVLILGLRGGGEYFGPAIFLEFDRVNMQRVPCVQSLGHVPDGLHTQDPLFCLRLGFTTTEFLFINLGNRVPNLGWYSKFGVVFYFGCNFLQAPRLLTTDSLF